MGVADSIQNERNDFYAEDPKVQKKLIRSQINQTLNKNQYLEDDEDMNKNMEYYKYSDYRLNEKHQTNPNYGGPMHEDSYQKMQKMNQINQNPTMMNEEMNMMKAYENDPMKGILEIMQNLSYTNPNQVNAQLFQGMLNASSANKQVLGNMMAGKKFYLKF